MAAIIFNPGENDFGRRPSPRSAGRLTRFVMRVTGERSEAAANFLLFLLALGLFIASLIILWRNL